MEREVRRGFAPLSEILNMPLRIAYIDEILIADESTDMVFGAATHVRRTVSRCFTALRQLATYVIMPLMTVSALYGVLCAFWAGLQQLHTCQSCCLPSMIDASRPFLTLQLIWCSSL